MGVEWDPAKAVANLQKHGISFEDASAALMTLSRSPWTIPKSQNRGSRRLG